MTIDEFAQKVEKEFDELAPGSLEPNKPVEELMEWSSMNLLLLLSFVKTEFGVNLSARELKKCETLQELYDVIQSKQQET